MLRLLLQAASCVRSHTWQAMMRMPQQLPMLGRLCPAKPASSRQKRCVAPSLSSRPWPMLLRWQRCGNPFGNLHRIDGLTLLAGFNARMRGTWREQLDMTCRCRMYWQNAACQSQAQVVLLASQLSTTLVMVDGCSLHFLSLSLCKITPLLTHMSTC